MSKKEIPQWIWWVLIGGFILFSLAPMVYEVSRMGDLHPERSFELVHNFPTDYNFYLSRIRQGLEGRFTVVERYTSEAHDGSMLHAFYLALGHVGRFVRVPLHRAGDIYHVARAVLGALFLIVIASLVQRAFAARNETRYALLGFLLAVTASSWPKLVAVVNNSVVPATLENIDVWRFGGYMAWWSVMDSLQRITFIPHLVLGQILIGVLVLGLMSGSMLRTSSGAIAFGLLACVLGFVFPPGLIFIYTLFGIWALLSWRHWKSWVVPLVTVGLVSAPSLLYVALTTSFYPWKRLAEADIIRPLPFVYDEYIRAVGPVLPLGIAGLVLALLRGEKRFLPAVAWVLAWITLLIVFSFIPQQSPLRFSEMAPHVPLAILATYMFLRMRGVTILRDVSKTAAMILIATGLFHMFSSYLWQRDFVDHKIRATLPLVPTGSFVMYPLKDFLNAMWYLYDVTKGDGVILSETTAGNYIPVISGNRVYAGHDNTVAFEAKKEMVRTFFSGRMDADQAKRFVGHTRASYVFFGPQEREDGGILDLKKMYPFLTETYRNTYVAVYKTP